MTLIAKPFITMYGDDVWCEHIEKFCIPNLPMEPTEWIRKTGSDYKLVHIDVDARRFNESELKDYGISILDGPLFHLFVIVENEDLYTKMDKSIFTKWIGALRGRSIESWRLFVVPDDGQKNKFSFSRFSILNKMKTEFNIQKIENHLIRISENPKERFAQIQTILRDIILHIYDDRCFKNEDKIRIQREAQFTPQWNYFDYFSLQEELADVYECLSLYEESLAQFDEANSVFVKCLEGFYRGEISPWINRLKDVPFDAINCLILTNYTDPQKRHDLSEGKLCLADFRAYLLSRQCALLQLLNRYQDIPALVYSVLISFLNECKFLNLAIESSIKNSWVFLTSLQALQRFNPIDCENSVAQDYAALFLLALNGINKLADDWNVWVEELIVWSPIERLTEKLNVLSHDEFGDTPSSCLAAGLKSQKHFQEFHSKLYEQALVTLKHIGRIRSANLIGVQLADLYCQVGKFEEAEPFYMKAIKCLRNENWTHLAMPLRLKLAKCQKGQFDRDPEKYLKTCVHLAGATFSESGSYFNSYLSPKNQNEHMVYYNELMQSVNKQFEKSETPFVFQLEPLFSIKTIKLLLPVNGYQIIELVLISHLPESVEANLLLCGERFPELDLTNKHSVRSNSIDTNKINEELNKFPAQFSIPLFDISSPQVLRTNKRTSSESKKKELYCQSSMEEDIQTLNAGVSVEISVTHNAESGDDSSTLVLVCFPRADAGLRARKSSFSPNVNFSVSDAGLFSKLIDSKRTKFVHRGGNIKLAPGENSVILRSEELGLFGPRNIEMNIFSDRLKLKDLVSDSKLDPSFNDVGTIETFLPDFLLESCDTIAFVNFQNELSAKIKMGLLSFSTDESAVEICVKNESCKEICSTQEIAIDDDVVQAMGFGSELSLCGPLRYYLDSVTDEIHMRVPGVIKRPLKIEYFEQIRITENIISTASSKYVVKVELQKPMLGVTSKVNYLIKSSSLKLHHENNLCQLLPAVHRSLSTGMFNERMQLTLLWFIESVDITKFDKGLLKFTLSLDLSLQVTERDCLSGSIRHEFELSQY